MTVFRWIMAVYVGFWALATAVSFAIFIGSGNEVWETRAKVARRWLSAATLLWFNIEVWRHVVLIIINW